ncbi:TonB-dependent receptor [Xanthomonas arboricola pv. corylina]|uniref:Vitamin B12 transporter BtuB n=1 Tax=Xanthomonas arboricola pv. corylina TaxID=487821 RepID=A0A2S7CQ57_9XANT|nr:TonB-dependent receptor [Xanthomonas arboricola]MDN0202436.1 TonB-dependent receptor [Xanthomonas arboricola pv. corylina]MDN0215041.1 TonB-dependent receptor [Xanthomonas arboricola pv. corylina]PPU16226.1 TonB-dependent receptor [Xanthomonas arboricola pv. corylina]PPU63728.1 TonB-dependent receptor [Xanthomonas arboricola pv. corylina]UQQ14814.1 TonB-dependent receptor [Xanthomonas arboricola pv. corylina]
MHSRTTTLALCITAALYCSGSAMAAGQEQQTPAATPSATTELDTITVTGYRASLEKSQSVKRSANSIVDAISAEDIGKFPDINAAESLSHLPGISVDRQFGEGEKVSINGTDPALNRVLLNGQTIASGDWGGNPTDTSGRTFNYTLLSPEIIGLMEVYKTPEARIDEGSIGGTVIVHTRKPLDLPKNTIRGSVGYNYNDRSEEGNPRGSALWSWKNDDETFGALISATHDKQDLARAGIEYFGYTTGANIPASATITGDGSDVATARVPAGINSAFFQQTRERSGVQGALQWKPNEQNEFNLTGLYIKGKYNNFSESRYVCPACNNDLQKVTSANVQNGVVTSATFGDGAAGQPYAQLDANYRESTVTTKSLNLRHDWSGEKWVFTTQVGDTKATGGKNPEYLMKFLMTDGGYNYAFDGQNTAVNYDNGGASNWTLPGSPAGLPAGSQDSSAMQAGGIFYQKSTDEEKYFQWDAARDLELGPFTKLLFGYKYINHNNGVDARGNRINTTDAISLTQFNPGTTPSGLYDGLGASGDLTTWPTASLNSIRSYLLSQPQGPYRPDYGSSFEVKEITQNFYTQLNYETGKWRGNVGVRLVDTTDKSLYWQTADGGTNYSRVAETNDYRKALPSFNIAYDITDDAVLRFSAAKVIARPRYGDLAGTFSINSANGNLTAGGGNPDLKPYESTNYDLAAEWYFAPSSMLSGEVFYRDISSYIVNTTSQQQLTDPISGNSGIYTVTSPINVSDAKVKGVSVNYQQSLGLGFGVQANYTFAESDSSSGLNLPYLSRDTYNIIPYWEHGDWMVRVNYSFRSKYFTQIGRLASQDFADSYKQLDLTASYQITDYMGITFGATNLLDSTYRLFSNTRSTPTAFYKNGRGYQAQLNFKF